MKSLIQLLLISSVGLSLAACSGGLQSKGVGLSGASLGNSPSDNGQGGLSQTPVEQVEQLQIDTKVAEDAALDAEQALAEAEAALAELVDSKGDLKIFSAGASVASAEVEAQFVSGKVEEVLNKALDKLKIVPQTFDTARAKLTEVMSKLDANNPAHKMALDKIMLVMGKLDDAQARVRVLTAMLADKIDILLVKVDELSAKLSQNIFTSLLLFEVQKVKTVIVNFKNAVKAL